MKIIVAGSRTVKDKIMVFNKLKSLHRAYPNMEIVSGCASGPDTFAINFANENEVKIHMFPADWNKFGKRAGYIRNEEMAKFSDGLLIFWDGISSGSKHMITLAIKHKLKIKVIDQYGNYKKLNREEFL